LGKKGFGVSVQGSLCSAEMMAAGLTRGDIVSFRQTLGIRLVYLAMAWTTGKNAVMQGFGFLDRFPRFGDKSNAQGDYF
jgi:hypothetical protein